MISPHRTQTALLELLGINTPKSAQRWRQIGARLSLNGCIVASHVTDSLTANYRLSKRVIENRTSLMLTLTSRDHVGAKHPSTHLSTNRTTKFVQTVLCYFLAFCEFKYCTNIANN
jgi:hypothetical protein